MAKQVRALVYLQLRIARNWVRRSTRSIVAWALFIGAMAFLLSGFLVGSDAELPESGDQEAVDNIYFQASAVVLFIGTLMFAVWRGTGPPPGATAADVTFVVCSPISSRLQFAYLMFRDVAALLSVLTLVAILSLIGPVIRAITTAGESLEGAFSSPTIAIWLVLLIGGVLRLTVWVATEQAVVQNPRGGHRLRQGIRAALIAVGGGLLAYISVPVLTATHESYREMIDHAVDRVMDIARIPPLMLPADVYSETGSAALPITALIAIAVATGGVGLLFARDFAEPLAITAERNTDARGQARDSGNDLQWSTISQLGAAPRLKVTLRPFGRGPWALFWSSLLRWMRYQMSVAWVSILMLAGVTVVAVVLVQMGVISTGWIWGLALTMPFFSSYNNFLDELRKPFLFLTPGHAWKRLVAAGATSVIDGVLAAALLVVVVMVAGAVPPGEALLIMVAASGLGFLVQASVGLVQVVLPSWLNRKIRTALTFGMNAVAVMPAAVAFFVGLSVSGMLAGFVAGVVTMAITSIVLLVLSVLLFDRLEMPG